MKKIILFAILIYIQSETDTLSLINSIITAFIVCFLPNIKKTEEAEVDEYHRKQYFENYSNQKHVPYIHRHYLDVRTSDDETALRRMNPHWFK